ncbi:NADH-quinone oxidoreductase subunit C [Aeromicrobium sp. CF4.19]|uniref:NADH-quinone oxidoreductase subunit C n=1 Tax=Aeromicrobium sp. CF4.19 TaxID=3373082 RepID=UPI003EE6FAF4
MASDDDTQNDPPVPSDAETVDEHTDTQDASHETRDALAHADAPVGPEPWAPGAELPVVDVREGMFGVRGSGDTSGYGGLERPVVMPGASQPPFGGWFDDVHRGLDDGVAEAIEHTVVDRGEITFFIRREHLLAAVTHLRNDPALRFEHCSSVSGVHFPQETGRELHVAYHLLSMTHNRRIRLEVTAPDADPHVPSVVSVYPTADWHERETWDMFGVEFDGHPALTRILMPDDWQGHPQRKDYPLGGIPVEYKGGTIPAPDQRRSYS